MLTKDIKFSNEKGLLVDCGDPFILKYEGIYYLYCTSDREADFGIKVYTSKNLVDWSEPAGKRDGYALRKEDVHGNRWFWAGDVTYKNGKFYMFYTAEEHIAVAVSSNPLGPFIQEKREFYHNDIQEIDGAYFMDDDGKAYIYFSRLFNANVIYGAELTEDLMQMKEETMTRCVEVSQAWERGTNEPIWPVNEGAFIWKRKGVYYLIYTANHFESIDYAVGYAWSDTPLGPWKKYEGNPILQANKKVMGPGNGIIIEGLADKNLWFAYHTHFDSTTVRPRKLAIDKCYFKENPNGGPDILVVEGPTLSEQRMN